LSLRDIAVSKNKVALVTGSANGIGRACALSLAQSGIDLVLVDLEKETLGVLYKAITSEGFRATTICGDCQNAGVLDEVFETAEREFGGVDILVNNVGRSARECASSFAESTPDTWLSILEISLMTTLQVTYRAVPRMTEKGWGRIINMSSDAALVGDAGLADYAAAKSGLLGFTRVLARELALHGVTVNAICPGAIRTRAHDHLHPSILERVISDIPMKRVGEPEDVANLVTFLSGDRAGYITGQTIAVNGGRHMT
jgi:acetoacetyl-CoA reductase/3-oxoacyl-[acyl-carrier protein] reductase|tara:strand:- start:1450 stop:2220 length:771 start_codon:yes stop_codon:yes gene_type:complete